MERSNGRLYSGPLSRAAQMILAALRSQSLHAGRRSHSDNHRQMERFYGSQRERPAPSSWTASQEESRDAGRQLSRPRVSSFSASDHDSSSRRRRSSQTCYQSSQTAGFSRSSQLSPCWDPSLRRPPSQTEGCYQQIYRHREYSEPPAYQSSRSLPFPQHEVTAAPFSYRDRPWRNSTEEIRPPFIRALSPHNGVPDDVLSPNTLEGEPPSARQTLSSRFQISEKTRGDTTGAQEEKNVAQSWNIPANECSDSRETWKLPPSNFTEEAVSGGEGGGMLHQRPQCETFKTRGMHQTLGGSVTTCLPKPMRNLVVEERMELEADSESTTEAGTGQMSSTGPEIQVGVDGVTCEREHRGPTLLNEKESASEMAGIWFLATNKETSPERTLNLSSTSAMDRFFDCDTEREKVGEREENNFEYRVKTPQVEQAEPGSENNEISGSCHGGSPKNISASLKSGGRKLSRRAETPQDPKHRADEPPVQRQTKLVPADNAADNPERATDEKVAVTEVRLETGSRTEAGMDASAGDEMETEAHICPDVQPRPRRCEADYRGDTESGESGRGRDESVNPPVDSDECTAEATEDSGGESGSTPLVRSCGVKRSGFRALCLHGNRRHRDNVQTANGSIRGSSSSVALAPMSTSAAGQLSSSESAQGLSSTAIKASKKTQNINLPISVTNSHHARLVPSFPLKRKHELHQHQSAYPPHKIYLARRPPKWEPPHYSQDKAGERGINELKRARPKTSIAELPAVSPEPQTRVSPSHKTGLVLGLQKDPNAPTQTPQIRQSELEERSSNRTPSSVAAKPFKHKRARCEADQETGGGPKVSHAAAANAGEPQNQPRASCLSATLTSDARIKDAGKLSPDEKMRMLERAGEAKALVLTLVYQDGTTQLDPEQKLGPPVCGLLALMKNDLDRGAPEDPLGPNDSLVYLKLEHTPAWAQQHAHASQEHFTRDVLLQVLSRSQLVVCYKAKDLLRTALQFYRRDLSWKRVAGCLIQDPQVSGWLLDPADPSSCYRDLLSKHGERRPATSAPGVKKVSRVISGLCSLFWLNTELCSKLQSRGLWALYSDMELSMISVLAAMESHRIHVDKEALKRTSDLLGTKMRQLEQEAHRAAGQMFLLTSNTQLRAVLFEKLCLHERCENKKLPKTVNKQQQSTSEAALLQLQDLHPLPKIILEYRQVHKIKSTFVDGILSCMMSKDYISSTWCQTSVVTGRISAKHPNFQALPRQPLQITKKQHVQGKEEEVVTVHPRAMFIPQEGWTFLAADFCQVELRLLAHLSADPELLRIFTHPQADVFTMLASQWKGVHEAEVTSEDREHAKRVVYSVVYGAGRERLSGILGVSAEQAGRFQDSFLQTYREVQAFIQRTVQTCHRQGYVLSIMGRRRTLPNINSPIWGVRMQAERQAVNFVVQGSAADLCKMAMIRIFNLVSSSSSLSARLIAQLHDELLYEVEDSQVEQFAALVKSTMESLQHVDHPRVHLKVPLKVAVSSGKSWGSMSELNIPPTSPSSSLSLPSPLY